MNDNRMTITVITSTVALMAFVCAGCVCFLSYKGIKIPAELNTITGGLIGSLTTMLVKTSPTSTTPAAVVPLDQVSKIPTPVVVTNTPDNPAETHENT